MSINGIEAISGLRSLTPANPLTTLGTDALTGAGLSATAPTAPSAASGVTGPQGPSFGELLTQGIDRLESMTDKTDSLAVQAATGDLNAIHDYTIAASETSVATQLAVTLRNKGLEAFNEIMRMPV